MSITRMMKFKAVASGLSPAFIIDNVNTIAIESLAIPALRTPTVIPNYGGATIERVTDWTMLTEDTTDDDANRAWALIPEYSKQTAHSNHSDPLQRKMACIALGGANRGSVEVRWIKDGVLIGRLSTGGDAELNWHPTDHQKAFYVGGINPATIKRYNADDNTSTTIANPKDSGATAYYRAFTGQEGRPNHAFTRIGLQCRIGSDTGNVDIVVWDLVNDVVIGRRPNIRTIATATVSAAGTGYNVSDKLQIDGGTRAHASWVKVATLTGGPGTGVATVLTANQAPGDGVTSNGIYDTLPSSPASTTALTGGGSGCTLTFTNEPYWPNNVALSPSGNYLAVMAASGGANEYTELWDATSSTLAFLRDAHIQPSHDDWFAGTDDDYIAYYSANGLQVAETGGIAGCAVVRAGTGVKVMALANNYEWGLHLSGQLSYAYPGWFLLGTERALDIVNKKYANEFLLINGQTLNVRRILHHHGRPADNANPNKFYYNEPWGCSNYAGNCFCYHCQWDVPSYKQLTGISRTGTTVTVTDVGHGYTVGQLVYLHEPSPAALSDGGYPYDSKGPYRFTIATVPDVDHYTYETTSSGTISGGTAYQGGRGVWSKHAAFLVYPGPGKYWLP